MHQCSVRQLVMLSPSHYRIANHTHSALCTAIAMDMVHAYQMEHVTVSSRTPAVTA